MPWLRVRYSKNLHGSGTIQIENLIHVEVRYSKNLHGSGTVLHIHNIKPLVRYSKNLHGSGTDGFNTHDRGTSSTLLREISKMHHGALT